MRSIGCTFTKQEILDIQDLDEISEDMFVELMRSKFQTRSVNFEIKRAFRILDATKSREISVDDFLAVAEMMGDPVSKDEIAEMFVEVGWPRDGVISEDEFVRAVMETDL